MNKSGYAFNANSGNVSRMQTLLAKVVAGDITPQSLTGSESLSSIFGAENFALGENSGLSYAQQNSALGAARGVFASGDKFLNRLKGEVDLIKRQAGFESFTAQLTEGTVANQKAATIELNAEANKQFKAAEAMYPTVQIGSEETMINLPVDVAGVGNYNIGGNVNDAYEDLRPIASTLSDSKFNPGDELKLVPVFVDDTKNPGYSKFVSKTDWAPTTENYDAGDLLGRESHLTNFLKPVKIDNLMNLCRAPGATQFEANDEIESSSIRVKRVLIKIKTKDGEGVFVLDTSNYPGNAMRTGASLNAKSERQLILKTDNTTPKSLKDKDGKDATALFASLGNLTPALHWELNLTYHRDSRTLTPTVSSEVPIYQVVDEKGVRMIAGASRTPEDVNELITAQAVDAKILGFELEMNHNNANWSRYGQTIVYANVNKPYNIRSRTPIHVRYPMSDDDNNAEILAKCIKSMGLMISRNMTHDAFKHAIRHFDFLMENNNKKVVHINDTSNDTLPAQYFFTTAAREDSLNLKKTVSTLDTKDALGNIQAALVNKITDAITDIRVRSGFAAIKEVDGREEKYTIVAHSALAPFLITTGDVRTFGQNVKFDVIETNVDTEVGRFWIFPASQTKDGSIDAFGGLGICVSRELLVIEGSVQAEERQYRMLITQPSYEHHSIGCIASRIEIEDIQELMAEGGVLSSITRHLVNVEGTLDGAGNGGGTGANGNEIEVTPKP